VATFQNTGLLTPADKSRGLLMVADSASILKRFYWLQRELVRFAAGWMPGVSNWQSKLLLPEFLWQDALICNELRQRVLELRYPLREIDLPPDESLVELWSGFAAAPSGEAFTQGLWRIVKPLFRTALSAYLQQADHLDDGPTIRILTQAIEDIDHQLARAQAASDDLQIALPDRANSIKRWCEGLEQWSRALGDLLAPTQMIGEFDPSRFGGKPFSIQRLGERDPRFRRLKFAWPDMLDPKFGAGEGLRLQVRQAVHHLNEVWAAEMAAASLYDLSGEADHEFLVDAARWCYDEIRHCRMGFTRLREWGFTLDRMPLCAFSYNAGAESDALTRLGIIFYFESTYIHTKSQRMKIFGQAGDRVSSHDMDFDWADEQIHAHYGSKWLGHFLKKRGDTRAPVRFRSQAEDCIEAYRRGASEADRAESLQVFEETMALAQKKLHSTAPDHAG
jgi:uncharacterized ferritin-like protein (DUF455 family)